MATTAPRPAIALQGVSLDLGGRTILHDITFDAAPGSFVTIIGASGSGKTTLLRLIAGLYVPSKGRVLLNGAAVTGPSRCPRTRPLPLVIAATFPPRVAPKIPKIAPAHHPHDIRFAIAMAPRTMIKMIATGVSQARMFV